LADQMFCCGGKKTKQKQAHPSLTESECKRLCKLIDCQKLSQDASSHAAQNDRLPIQMVVRVLYFEQLRLKSSFSGGGSGCVGLGGADGSFSQRFVCSSSGVPSSCVSPQRDNYASLRRENRELKLEISRMRVRLTELEREQGLMKQQGRMRGGDGGGGGGRGGGGEHGRAFLASLSRGIGRITMFGGPAAADRRRKKSGGRSSQCSDGKARRRQKASFAYD
jgi:hypothetical protein